MESADASGPEHSDSRHDGDDTRQNPAISGLARAPHASHSDNSDTGPQAEAPSTPPIKLEPIYQGDEGWYDSAEGDPDEQEQSESPEVNQHLQSTRPVPHGDFAHYLKALQDPPHFQRKPRLSRV